MTGRRHPPRMTSPDLPRQFTIREGELRILNPFDDVKLATLGRAIRLRPGDELLDLCSGKGELLCTWARDHGITGTGVDISTVFTAAARERAAGLGVADRVRFVHGDAAAYAPERPVDVAAASARPGSAAGCPERWNCSTGRCGRAAWRSSASPTGGATRRTTRRSPARTPGPVTSSATCPVWSSSSASAAGTWSRWSSPTRTAGTGTPPRTG
ncbi:methyltransferase domain-containing protein [Micromonospora sp. BRA006-A]|nr:methyltransferase domain-containing protein [Micromonospora sp. BRA006-A]